MTIAEFIVKRLMHYGVTDVFGIPGGVVLEFLYAAEHGGINVHLNCHEQASGFAAVGYAQVNSRLGVAYSTRGPGLTNMITAIADAYYSSVPVLFITAHSKKYCVSNVFLQEEQEFDTVSMIKDITKYAARAESEQEVVAHLQSACEAALAGRPGPVFIDILSALFSKEINTSQQIATFVETNDDSDGIVPKIETELQSAKRPVLLIGDGIHQTREEDSLRQIAEKMQIPVLSSRFAQDIMADSELYFGIIGSHGMRYANYILSKSDLILAVGNRLHFNRNSETFKTIATNAKFVRLDCDANELAVPLPDSLEIECDLSRVLPYWSGVAREVSNASKWVEFCSQVKKLLVDVDVRVPEQTIEDFLKHTEKDAIFVADVGNNQLWLSLAYEHLQLKNRLLYSKSFGTLGCALPKAIGVWYATKKPVYCFTGDQGLMYNIQELQFIAANRLPINVVLLNNESSGMIRDVELRRYKILLHTTIEDGYYVPNFKKIADAYGVRIVELNYDDSQYPLPFLPRGRECWDFDPRIDDDTKNKLSNMEKGCEQ